MRSDSRNSPCLSSPQSDDYASAEAVDLESLSAEPALLVAWHKVRANGGAPGVDGVTVRVFTEKLAPRLRAISATLRADHYQPTPLRAVTSPRLTAPAPARWALPPSRTA